MRLFGVIVLLVGALLIAGCGSSETTATDSTSSTTKDAGGDEATTETSDLFTPQPDTPIQAETKNESADKDRWASLERQAGADASRLVLPAKAPQKQVEIADLREGTGKKIEPLDWFTVNYAQFDYKTGAPGERQWGGQAFRFVYGKHEIVPALEVGMLGMRVGGVREIIAPSKFVYGNPPRVYLVELVKLSDHY